MQKYVQTQLPDVCACDTTLFARHLSCQRARPSGHLSSSRMLCNALSGRPGLRQAGPNAYLLREHWRAAQCGEWKGSKGGRVLLGGSCLVKRRANAALRCAALAVPLRPTRSPNVVVYELPYSRTDRLAGEVNGCSIHRGLWQLGTEPQSYYLPCPSIPTLVDQVR